MCDKAVDTCPFVFYSILDWYKSQEMCYKAVNTCLPALKCLSDWFVTNEMVGKLHCVVFSKMI